MPRYATRQQAAKHFQVHERTVRNWMGHGLIHGYKFGPHQILVDLDETELMLAVTPVTKARDGRKLYGPQSRIVDMSNVVLPAQDSGQ
jgi:hypothetical protein